MEVTKSTESILEDIADEVFEGGVRVSVISKTGLMISGKRQFQLVRDAEDYSSLVAVLFSAAESSGKVESANEELGHIKVSLSSTKILVTRTSSTLVLAVRAASDADDEDLLRRMERFMVRTREELTWLR